MSKLFVVSKMAAPMRAKLAWALGRGYRYKHGQILTELHGETYFVSQVWNSPFGPMPTCEPLNHLAPEKLAKFVVAEVSHD